MSNLASPRVFPALAIPIPISSSRRSATPLASLRSNSARWANVIARSAGPPFSRAKRTAAPRSSPAVDASDSTSSVDGLKRVEASPLPFFHSPHRKLSTELGMGAHPTPLAPNASKGHYSVARLDGHWFITCRSSELEDRPRPATLQGVPLVLFRGEGGRPGALEDRCPHRNAPLTAGRVKQGHLECAYHGWRFDQAGRCRAVPGLPGEPEAKATR